MPRSSSIGRIMEKVGGALRGGGRSGSGTGHSTSSGKSSGGGGLKSLLRKFTR